MFRFIALGAFAALSLAGPATAQDLSGNIVSDIEGNISRSSGLAGQMTATMSGATSEAQMAERLRFEPWQMLDDLFRDDIVLLMRHGPTDWSKRDEVNVAPDDCANQRVMTPEGKDRMRELGILMVVNDVVPGQIVVSEWCRNQETYEAMRAGMLSVDPSALDDVVVETEPDLNLLLSLQGAPNVTAMRSRVAQWTGEGASGPLLLISHYTNIEEMTEFRVYEGEMLIVDPTRSNRVLGYLRLESAGPDVGHFDVEVIDESN